MGKVVKNTAWKLLAGRVIMLVLFAIGSLTLLADSQADKVDSLKNLLKANTVKDTIYLRDLIQLGIWTRNENVEESQGYFKQAIALSEKLGATKFQIRALNGLGISHGMLAQYPEAIQNFEEALLLALNDEQYLGYAANSYNSLGIVYKGLGDYPQSLSFYAKALTLYDSLNDEEGAASTYDNMGILFDLMRDHAHALEYYQKALAIYRKHQNERRIAAVNSNMALLYLQKEQYKKAIDLYENSLVIYTRNDLKTAIVEELVNLGYAHYMIKDFGNAEHYLRSALAEAGKLKLDQSRINALYTFSKLKADLAAFPTAIRFAKKANVLADSIHNLSLRSKSHELLSYVFDKAGDRAKALDHYKTYKALEDSIFSENKLKAFKSQQVLMEVHDKDRQIQDQALRLALLNRQINLENKWNWALGMASISLLIAGLLYYQKYRARIKYTQVLEQQNSLITTQKNEIERINLELEEQIMLRKETDETINYFATSLFGKNRVEEILWDVAKNCISRLGLVDCVIYLLDEKKGVLVQKAAYGTKNPENFDIHDPIEIPLGHGIVGAVAESGRAEIVNDTTIDSRYIVDDEARLSELAVPLAIHNKVIGVIDTEHPQKNFYTQYHLDALNTIASICASKIAQAQADEEATRAREAQQEADQIKKLDQLKSQFFANISHEFRTPLNLILAPLQKKQSIPMAEVEMMDRNAKRLLRLVNQLLDLAKLEVGLLKQETRNINIFRFVSDIANSFLPMAEAKEIIYGINIPERDYIGMVDPDKVEKIVYNLLSNAFKFTPIGGTVNCTVSVEEEDQLLIVVSDTGIGIPETLKEKIFRRFYQVDGSATRAYEGSGIGLALTKELVDLLNGRIEVWSPKGKGTTFLVQLPVVESTGRDSEEVAFPETDNYFFEAGVASDNRNVQDELFISELPLVLMVEDNMDLRTYVKKELRHHFNVIEAINGEEGFAIARRRVPDLIITDIMMPVMDGVTMTKHLRQDDRTSHIPVILLTARDDGETKIKGFETGAEQYVVKPFEIAELLARMNSLLSQRERLRHKFSQEMVLKPSDVVVNDRDALFLDKVIKIIEDNLNQDAFTVEDLQREIGMSRMQLHRKLKALTNQSASDFIRNIKLKRAAQILRQPGIPVAEAAYRSGFSHLSYFSKCFKEQFGVLPSEYTKVTADT